MNNAVRTRFDLSSRLLLALPALALLWFALRNVSWRETLALLRQIDPGRFLLLVALNSLILLTMSARWWLFLRVQDHRISYGTLFRYRLASFGISYFTPGPHFGGEPLQVYLLKERHGVENATAIAAVTLDKLIDLLFNFIFLAGGLTYLLQSDLFAADLADTPFAYALLLPALPLLLFAALARGWHPLSSGWQAISRLWKRSSGAKRSVGAGSVGADSGSAENTSHIYRVIRASEDEIIWLCRKRPKVLVAALVISSATWLLLLGEFWLATHVLGLGLSLRQALLVMVAARVAILLPLPAGLGALEASLVFAMSGLGLTPEAGISLGILIRGRDLLVGLVGLWLGSVELRAISRSRAR